MTEASFMYGHIQSFWNFQTEASKCMVVLLCCDLAAMECAHTCRQ